jgi:choline dehydrogenase-like flavoprotein
MRTERYDIIIIGSGAGGGTLAYALADSSARILIVERGDFVPQEAENWSPEAVWKHLRYQTKERWIDDRGQEFRPYTHYNVGGNTKFWGSVLYRLRREDFQPLQHMEGVSPGWPIDYDALEPYYDRAEQLYEVHGELGTDPTEPQRRAFPHPPIPHSEGMAAIVDELRAQGLHPSPLPLGIRDGCLLCNTCNSFACKVHAKSEADVCCVRPALQRPNMELWTHACARRLLTNPRGDRIDAVEVEIKGEIVRVEASLVVVSCGAVNSAALLLRSANEKHPNGLANSSGLVGRRYMAHLATMMQGFHPFRKNATVFQKTVAINDFYFRGSNTQYPLGQIQSQGRTHGVMAQSVVPQVPLSLYEWWVARGVDWLAMSEDLPDANNRVVLDRNGRIQLLYRPNNLKAHRMLVREARRILRKLGYWVVMTHSHGARNTTHQCGTLVFGADPRESVLDTYCRTHDIENMFVVDASFFPGSAAVNPALTIAAQALRVADHIKTADLKVGTTKTATITDRTNTSVRSADLFSQEDSGT